MATTNSSIRAKEVTIAYKHKARVHIKRIVDVFDEAYAGVLMVMNAKTVRVKSAKRPIPFIRSILLQEINKMYPIFGEDSNGNYKLINQEMIANELGRDRTTFPHHNKLFEQDKIFFKPIYEMIEVKRSELNLIARDISNLSAQFEEEKRKALNPLYSARVYKKR